MQKRARGRPRTKPDDSEKKHRDLGSYNLFVMKAQNVAGQDVKNHRAFMALIGSFWKVRPLFYAWPLIVPCFTPVIHLFLGCEDCVLVMCELISILHGTHRTLLEGTLFVLCLTSSSSFVVSRVVVSRVLSPAVRPRIERQVAANCFLHALKNGLQQSSLLLSARRHT